MLNQERWPKTGTPDALLAKIGYNVFSKSGDPPGRHLIGSRPPAPFLGQYSAGCTQFWRLTPPRVPDPQRSLPDNGRAARLQQPAHTSTRVRPGGYVAHCDSGTSLLGRTDSETHVDSWLPQIPSGGTPKNILWSKFFKKINLVWLLDNFSGGLSTKTLLQREFCINPLE